MTSEETGWVSLWRELYKKPIWANSTPEHKAVLIVLLGLVNHEPTEWEWKGKSYTVKRGQTITSLQSIKILCGKGVSIQNIRTSLLRFEKLHFLTNESTKTGRKLTICNYDTYQKQADKANKDSNKELTKDQQRGNKDLTPNNKDNKDNKDNKRKRFTPPSLGEVSEYIKSKGYSVDASAFIDFYTSKGWMVGSNKMKDWKASVRTWVNRNKPPKAGQPGGSIDYNAGFAADMDYIGSPAWEAEQAANPEPEPEPAPFPGALPKPLVPPKPQYETVGGV